MHSDFPQANHIDAYLEAIREYPEFVVKRDERSGIIVLNYIYQTENTFAVAKTPEEARLVALRRECRGIKFDINTGLVVARPYHKFHNVDEREDTALHLIDWSQTHWVLAKMDGSMITCHVRQDGKHEWHTKMGATEVAQPVGGFVEQSPIKYVAFVDHVRAQGGTAIFEWCSRKQRIIIDYPEDTLMLTAVRDNHSGQYMPYPEMLSLAQQWGVPAVPVLWEGMVRDGKSFLAHAAALEAVEGYVIRFASGAMLKIKGEWYTRLHRSNDGVRVEKNVWDIVLSDALDDVLPLMLAGVRESLQRFNTDFWKNLAHTAQRLNGIVEEARASLGEDKKRFALEVANARGTPSIERGLLFQIWGGKAAQVALREFLGKNINTQPKIDEVRYLVGGINWADYLNKVMPAAED